MRPGYKAISIPLELVREIDKIVGRRNRSAFILDSAQRYLADPALQSMLRLKRQARES
jgi:metal-responsive CopG/Arc/MetJ family transcriptional regulator